MLAQFQNTHYLFMRKFDDFYTYECRFSMCVVLLNTFCIIRWFLYTLSFDDLSIGIIITCAIAAANGRHQC